MPTNADVVSIQQEKLRSKLPDLFETSSFLLSEIKRGSEVENISTRDYRIPVLVSLGGDYRKFDPDGGDMGRGSGPLTKHYVASYFNTVHAIELTKLQIDATAKSEQAVKKAFALATARAMKVFQALEDAGLHVSGGVIGTATAHSAPSGKSIYTLDTKLATQLLRRQLKVHVYDTTLATNRTSGGAVRCEAITPTQVTLASTIGSAAATDKLLFDGVSGASPTWKKGIPDFINTLTTGNLLSLSRDDYPEIHSNWVNANSGALMGVHGMLLIDQIEQRRDDVGSLTAVFHMKQRTAWYKAAMAISEWQRGKGDSMIDIVPKRAKEFQFAGLRSITDKHADRTVVNVLDFSKWGRAVLRDVDWYTLPGRSDKIYPLYGTSGGLAAGMVMYICLHDDRYSWDPGCQGLIYGLQIPTAV